MRRYLVIFLTACSLLLCIAAGWCWQRSYTFADIISRDSLGESCNTLKGIGSYRGAFIIGSLQIPRFPPARLEINRRVYAVAEQRGKMQAAVAGKRGALGFGVAEGTLQLPVLGFFKTPPMPYHIIFIPYYAIMLLTALLPAWRAIAFVRRSRVSISSSLPIAEPAGA